jgi:predicted transglutaminase-like protease
MGVVHFFNNKSSDSIISILMNLIAVPLLSIMIRIEIRRKTTTVLLVECLISTDKDSNLCMVGLKTIKMDLFMRWTHFQEGL